MTDEAKTKEPEPVVLYSVEDGKLVPVSGVDPFVGYSARELKHWLKKNAQLDGVYVFVKVMYVGEIKKVQTTELKDL